MMKNKLNILLVDDSKLILSHLKSILREIKGITLIESAETILSAEKILKDNDIDLIVLDIQLPDGNGIDFLKWVKFKYKKIIVIMLSNQADEYHRSAAEIAGAEYFFDKSF